MTLTLQTVFYWGVLILSLMSFQGRKQEKHWSYFVQPNGNVSLVKHMVTAKPGIQSQCQHFQRSSTDSLLQNKSNLWRSCARLWHRASTPHCGCVCRVTRHSVFQPICPTGIHYPQSGKLGFKDQSYKDIHMAKKIQLWKRSSWGTSISCWDRDTQARKQAKT